MKAVVVIGQDAAVILKFHLNERADGLRRFRNGDNEFGSLCCRFDAETDFHM